MAVNGNSVNGFLVALASLVPLSGLLGRFAHRFSGSSFDDENHVTRYEEPRGVRITVNKLNKSFEGHHVLKDIDLDIQPGETFSIIGPSGTGKSLLLKHIVKLIDPDSGTIRIDGRDIHEPRPDETSPDFRYSMVFQSSALFNSLTVGENVGL